MEKGRINYFFTYAKLNQTHDKAYHIGYRQNMKHAIHGQVQELQDVHEHS